MFDVDGDVVIDAGDSVATEYGKFKSDASNEGATYKVLITSGQADAIDAEGAETQSCRLLVLQLDDVHTLRTTG